MNSTTKHIKDQSIPPSTAMTRGRSAQNWKVPRLPHLPPWEAFLAVREALITTARTPFIATRDALLFDYLSTYGMRISEALSIRAESVDLLRGWFRIRGDDEKTGQEKTYPLTQDLLDRTSAFLDTFSLDEHGYLFQSQKGGRIRTTAWLDYRFNVARKAAGLDTIKSLRKSGHGLRHLHAHQLRAHAMTRWARAGKNVKEIAAFFQVHELTALRHYLYVEEEKVKNAVLNDPALLPLTTI